MYSNLTITLFTLEGSKATIGVAVDHLNIRLMLITMPLQYFMGTCSKMLSINEPVVRLAHF